MKTIDIPDADTADSALTISSDKVCGIVLKMRAFDVKVADNDPDSGSNPTDDGNVDVLEDKQDDPVAHEIMTLIADLNEDEQIDLVALSWLGRGDGMIDEWATLRQQAADARTDRAPSTARYILGTPLLAQYLEEGLAAFGLSCSAYEAEQEAESVPGGVDAQGSRDQRAMPG